MIYVKQGTFAKKTFWLLPIFTILLLGLNYFYLNQSFFYNFRPYYLKAYLAELEYASDNVKSLPGFLAAAIFKRGEFYNGGAGLIGKAQSVPVLLYHGILPRIDNQNSEASEGTNVSIDQFKNQMFALKKAGWNTVSLEDFRLFMEGKKDLPKKSFLLTFDDGRKESFYPADPILAALGYRAVMFTITKFSFVPKSNYYLTIPELEHMKETGRWEIEAHGDAAHEFIPVNASGEKGYFLPNREWLYGEARLETMDEYKKRISDDFASVRKKLNETFGLNVTAFAFPYGEFGENSVNISGGSKDIVLGYAKENFPMTFHQFGLGEHLSQNYPQPGKDFFTIKRISARFEWTGQDIVNVLERGNAKSFPFRDNSFENSGWVSTGWGKTDFVDKTIFMRPSNGGSGAAVILDGARNWTNYKFSARVDWPKGKNIYLWARYQNDNNYVACNFSKSLVHIEQTIDGRLDVLKGESGNYSYPEGDFDLGIQVNGRKASCLVDGKTVLTTDFLDPALSEGSIGAKTWDPFPDNSEIIIKNVNVDAL